MQGNQHSRDRAKILLIALVSIIIAVVVAGGLFLKVMAGTDTFFGRTKINGYETDGMTVGEVSEMLLEKYNSAVVEIDENGVSEASGTLADFGYSIEGERLEGLLQKAMDSQRNGFGNLISSLISGSAYVLQVPFTVDEQTLSSAASKANLSDERIDSEDAYLYYDESSHIYSIVPEVYGNNFEDSALRELVASAINTFTTEKQAGTLVKVDIPQEIYFKPQVLSIDPDLNSKLKVYNQFCKAEVNYQFGSQIQTLGWDTIRDWIIFTGDSGVIDEERAAEYVLSLEEQYNTRYHTRHFHTSVGTDIEFPDYMNEYGYTINESAELEKLLENIAANESVTREPVYYTVSGEYENPVFYAREGTDDLAGSYVEVNLSAQHMWFYKHGALVVESDVVSGCVAKGTETQTGVFPLAYKESPSVLTGGNAENGYSTPVQYWMPFYEGQGLHDANWRGAFGGSIYMSSGSHGCVNLPPAVAAAVYNEIEPGMAILIYK